MRWTRRLGAYVCAAVESTALARAHGTLHASQVRATALVGALSGWSTVAGLTAVTHEVREAARAGGALEGGAGGTGTFQTPHAVGAVRVDPALIGNGRVDRNDGGVRSGPRTWLEGKRAGILV